MLNNSFKKSIFTDMVTIFNRERIPFCVLRNYEDYPEHMSGDLDVLVSNESLSRVKDCVREIARMHDAQVWDCSGDGSSTRMPLTVFRAERERIEALNLDFFHKMEIFGVAYADVESVLERKRPYKDFYVLDEQTEFLHVLVHGIYYSADFDHRIRYVKKIKNFLKEGRPVPEAGIRHLFPFIGASRVSAFLNKEMPEKLLLHERAMKILLLMNILASDRRLFVRKLTSYLKGKFGMVSRYIFPPGEFVAILGPDGVGKSTTAVLANELLKEVGVPAYHSHLGFRPSVLPRRQKLGLGEPHKAKKHPVRDLLRYCYHFLDYWFAYYLHIRPRLVAGEVVIAERDFYDYMLQINRKELGVSDGFVRWTFNLFMPKATACVLLANDPDEILKRRQELTKGEIDSILKKGRELGIAAHRFKEIRTDRTPEIIARELAEWIVCRS